MRRPIHIAGLVILCVLGSGTQWDLVQMFAWGRMFAANSQTMDVADAVRKTFDGEMCPICRMVAQAKRQEQPAKSGAPALKSDGPPLLICQSADPVVIAAPAADFLRPADVPIPAARSSAPPVPPPRQAAA